MALSLTAEYVSRSAVLGRFKAVTNGMICILSKGGSPRGVVETPLLFLFIVYLCSVGSRSASNSAVDGGPAHGHVHLRIKQVEAGYYSRLYC